jgi:transposase
VKSYGEIMNILEAYDLTGSHRAAAALAGCDHKTVKAYVERRNAGLPPAPPTIERDRLIDGYRDKLAEWVRRSDGRLRADVAHGKLVALGYQGSPRTTRRAVAEARRVYRASRRRVYKPWICEPGGWLQFDWGEGPRINGRRTQLWCGWLAWCRYRIVLPCWDKTLPTVIACLDGCLRLLGGAPTHVLTDNERTVAVDRVAGIAVVNPLLAKAAAHYGVTVRACVPADPESKGGSEATVRIAKADLVPTDVNLLDDYPAFVDLEAACELFCDRVNGREHRLLGRPPVEALADERPHLHAIPDEPFAAVFGQTRSVTRDATISVGGVRYSVPHTLVDERVWVREHGDELVIVHDDGRHGPREVARHAKSTKGHPQIRDEHYPPRSTIPGRTPTPASPEETAFLALGDGARQWLLEAAAAGTARMRVKMAEAVRLARLVGDQPVDRALGVAAIAGRFGDGDLAAIVDHHATTGTDDNPTPPRSSPGASLQNPLAGWEVMGR